MNTVIRKSSDKYSPTEEELERIRAISDQEIDFSDTPETDADFWSYEKKIVPTKQPESLTVGQAT